VVYLRPSLVWDVGSLLTFRDSLSAPSSRTKEPKYQHNAVAIPLSEKDFWPELLRGDFPTG